MVELWLDRMGNTIGRLCRIGFDQSLSTVLPAVGAEGALRARTEV